VSDKEATARIKINKLLEAAGWHFFADGNVAAGVRCATVTQTGVMWQTIIHTIFILSALGIAWTDRVMSGTAASKPLPTEH
jgi:uncharacterized membrane protein YqhA